jgi:hypothetical protein
VRAVIQPGFVGAKNVRLDSATPQPQRLGQRSSCAGDVLAQRVEISRHGSRGVALDHDAPQHVLYALKAMVERLSFLIAYVGSAALVAFFAAAVSQPYEHPEAQQVAQQQTQRSRSDCGEVDLPVLTVGDALVCASLAELTAAP